jgi:Lon protease-like protein
VNRVTDVTRVFNVSFESQPYTRAAISFFSKAAAAAAEAAAKAIDAIERGDAAFAAEAALECQEAAMASNEFIQNEIQKTQDLKQRLVKLGVKVEVIKGGGTPIDVMEHLGKRSGYNSVVWRAGE